MSPKGTILITGASGFIGFALLLGALRAGYKTHVVVRSADKRAFVASTPALLALPNNVAETHVTYFIVPDLAAPGALDDATRGCSYVLHAASPPPIRDCAPEEQGRRIIEPAVACTVAVLESAKAVGGVRRVVCVSSLGAFVTPEMLVGEVEGEVWIDEGSIAEEREPPFVAPFVAYCVSKAVALRRALAWVEAERRAGRVGFDFVAVAPGFVCGRMDVARGVADLWGGSNAQFLRLLAGVRGQEEPPPTPGCAAHVDDVVELHLKALDEEAIATGKEGTEVFLLAEEVEWSQFTEAAARLYPKEVEEGLLPNGGVVKTKSGLRFRSDKVERAFGVKLRGVDEMVKSIVPQYLELVEKEKALEGGKGAGA